MEEFQEKIYPFLKEHIVAVVVGWLGILCLVYGLTSLPSARSSIKTDGESIPSQPVRSFITPSTKQVTIDIEGAVQKPGVYPLPANSRIQDALIAAGGLAQNADRQRIAQTLNLAATLTDSAKLYIPAVGEQYAGPEGMSSNDSTTAVAGSSVVNINQASETDLDSLSGIGPVTAQKIIANRPYQSTQELLDKKIVGQSVFTKIKDKISVY